VGYEEGEEWVLSKMMTGYPRFFIHLTIQELGREVLSRYGRPGEAVMLFPSPATAKRCQQFFETKLDGLEKDLVRIIGLLPSVHSDTDIRENRTAVSSLFCVFFPKQHFSVAKQVWQHSGDGISSRRGEFCLKALRDGLLILEGETASTKHHQDQFCKGPRRYQRGGSHGGINGISHASKHPTDSTASVEVDGVRNGNDLSQFVEERFGRNLNAKLASKAKVAVRRRIAGCLTDGSELDQALEAPTDGQSHRIKGLTEDDVYLYPTGMSSIFNTHRILLACREEPRKSICFGFPYIDTLKILEKWGPGCLFYGNGCDSDLDDLERRLESGERYLALFTEFPTNPLLNSPDLPRIRQLADKYDFALVVDESIGNFINVNVLVHADVVVSSLTKAFSGDSNVMGGSAVLNPHGHMYQVLKKTLSAEYEDNYWAEDAVFLERNSRDFISRIERINVSAEAIAEKLHSSSIVKQVYYPKYSPTRRHYDRCRNPGGGYGGLLSVTFSQVEQAVAFFDALEVQKGPSLGTNFTLSCPYTILAHYGELEWAASFGVEADLIRISFGLEDKQDLVERVERALNAAERVGQRW
jgi:cystathionine gamma-synthase